MRAIEEGGRDLVAVVWQIFKGRVGSGPLLGRALQGGADARSRSVALVCRGGGLGFGLFGASESGATRRAAAWAARASSWRLCSASLSAAEG